jgi:hypothetical protein
MGKRQGISIDIYESFFCAGVCTIVLVILSCAIKLAFIYAITIILFILLAVLGLLLLKQKNRSVGWLLLIWCFAPLWLNEKPKV